MGLVVINPGLSTTIQDAGRPGYAAWGVCAGGAFDRGSAELANALLGNSSGCAVLEMTLVGGTFQAERPLALALAGAPIEARTVMSDRAGRALRVPSSFSLRDGEQLVLGHTHSGARTYLAVRGGWQTPQVLGSRSSEEIVRAGGRLPAAAASESVLSRHLSEPAWQDPAAVPFRIVGGPDCRSSPDLNGAFWARRVFVVGSRHDRKGLRLEGDPVTVVSEPERLSTPVAPGAIQVAGGQVIVLGVACGTMGGYPHVAQVISADLDRLGQLKAGDVMQFEYVTIEEARRVLRDAREERRALFRRVSLISEDGCAGSQGVALG
jgi:5-oxoprolinase (ATP-hydrolysing) subunit C